MSPTRRDSEHQKWPFHPLMARFAAALGALLLGTLPALASDDSHAQQAPTAVVGSGEFLVAGSVCEAHELRLLGEEDPTLVVEIPSEFAGQWPSRSACESARLAWDPEAPGPIQPIPFSHKHHAGEFGIDCQYCHSGTDRSPAAGVPSVEVCMGCHAQFPASYDEIEGIRILKEHWEEKRPIEWIQIHRLPEYVQFRHNRHLQAGLECQQCHGPVEKLDKLYLVPDEHWKYGVPVKKMEMGWCIDCHRDNDNQASIDCTRCHY
ncbi:MAG: cytochrome c family protein [Myxococcota bacterium]|nr:cytochrome c family protein [Myxococcota bacterium]